MGGLGLIDSVNYWSYVGLRLQKEYSKFVQYFVNTFYFYICQYVYVFIFFHVFFGRFRQNTDGLVCFNIWHYTLFKIAYFVVLLLVLFLFSFKILISFDVVVYSCIFVVFMVNNLNIFLFIFCIYFFFNFFIICLQKYIFCYLYGFNLFAKEYE